MDRKQTTKFLTNTLIDTRLSDRKYYAKEVTLDYGTSHPKRIDVMEFKPQGVTYASDIEKGIFVCYEIKSCYADVYSGNGLNFYGEKNYIVTTMETYKKLQEDMRSGKLSSHICNFMGVNTCPHYGIMVAVPSFIGLKDTDGLYAEYENPTQLNDNGKWQFWTIYSQVRDNPRYRSMNEMLFCMLRSKTNGN